MKKILPLILILFLPLCFSQSDWHFASRELILDLSVSSQVQLIPTGSDPSITYLTVNLSHIPYMTFNQHIMEYDTYPPTQDRTSNLVFRWQNPKDSVSFGYDARIRTTNEPIRITKKIPFPIRDLPADVRPYLNPQENIDSDNEKIAALASSLAGGQNDLYAVSFLLAQWTKENIEYDLSSLTADVSQKASWVLENREGVCDELTSLFIALARSVGIPAKFVSGVAYTNSDLFPEGWGSHGWAEIYFPGAGWVPYDVTYGQFGYIDPTHIKLKESPDSGDPSVQYRWLARNIDVKTQQLEIKADVEQKSGMVKDPISLSVRLLSDMVDFGSFNLIEVKAKNNAPYYVSSELYLSRPKEILLFEDSSKQIFLGPMESKSIFWVVRVPDNLERNYRYTFPVSVSTRLGSMNATLQSQQNELKYSQEEIDEILMQRKEEEKKSYSRDVLVECHLEKEVFYSYEPNNVRCTIHNTGNSMLEDIEVCFKDSCEEIDLPISQQKDVTFALDDLLAGKQSLSITVAGKQISKATYLDISVFDEPNVAIADASAPKQVSFDSDFTIEFLLKKTSVSNPKDLDIIIEQGTFKTIWKLEELEQSRKIIANLKGSDLKKGVNRFTITTKYKDANGKEYGSSSALEIELIGVNFLQGIYLYANGLVQRLSQLTLKEVVLLLIGSFIVFIVLIYYVFRRR